MSQNLLSILFIITDVLSNYSIIFCLSFENYMKTSLSHRHIPNYFSIHLPCYEINIIDNFVSSHLLQPIWIWQWCVGKRVFPLNVVPWRPDVVIPRNNPFHGIPDQIYVNRFRHEKPKGLYLINYN